MLFIRLLQYSLIFLIWVAFTPVKGQSFGGLKPNISWSQINTDTVRIIFPQYLTTQALRIANAIHYLKRRQVEVIGDRSFKIDILLNNQTTISNGFVSIAPWRSHFGTTPLQDNFQLTALPWLDLLALHEYRHVIQLSTARRGLVNWLYILFGQESWAGATNLSLPDWFTEGDAVWAETQQSSQGRGRITSFLEGYRALKFSATKYRYDKVRNGSLKDFVPDHYRLGYLLVNYGHDHFGTDLWKDVLIDAAAYKGIFYPFARSLKQKSGLTPSELYEAMWKNLPIDRVDFQHPEEQEEPSLIPQSPARSFTDYQYPHLIGDSLLVYFERSYDKIGKFYSYHLKTGVIQLLLTRGLSIDPYYGGNDNFLTWTEYSTDARWTDNDFNDIIVFNVLTKEKQRLTRRQKYFSPQADRSGQKIACVKFDETAESSLMLIDGSKGDVLKEFKHPNWVYTYPQFCRDDRAIISAVRDEAGRMALVQTDITTGEEKVIVPFLNRIIGIPEVYREKVYYSASTEGVEQIFYTDLQSGLTSQVTMAPNGAFQPAVSDTQLLYVTFTHQGHVIKTSKATLEYASVKSQPEIFKFTVGQNLLDSIPKKEFSTKKYNRITHSFNPHTWGLIVEDPEIIARVLSNNVLDNVELSAGVKYNYDEQNYRPFAEASIAAWYPTIDFQASTLNRSRVIENNLRRWRETRFYGGLSVSWNLISNGYVRSINPSLGINHDLLTGDLDLSITSATGQLTLQQQQIKARKNIFTHSGQYLQFRYNNAVDQFRAEQVMLRSGLVVRGLGRNHNLMVEADLKSDLKEAEYQFSNGLNHRGYGVIPGRQVLRLGIDYHLPLVYPDWGFAGLVYFYRVRLNPFYEFSRVNDPGLTNYFQSIGAEVVFDMNLINELAFSLGLRYSKPLEKGFSSSIEIFLPVYRF